MYEFAAIGLAVRTRRSDMGLTQERVADLCGLSPTMVEQLENGSIAELDWARALRHGGQNQAAITHLEHLILTYPQSALLPQARRELELSRNGIAPQS